ncbi:MAG: MFS transporter, partial [Planctomycetes bacterium]|nr:MFS transporter [Planctomycetota bacterium]
MSGIHVNLAPAGPPMKRALGVPPLPLLTLVNFFNYLDRQVVYGMTTAIGATFSLSKFELGMLAFVNLVVFAVASVVSGPIADRVGPRKVIFAGVLVWSISTIGSAVSTSYAMLLVFRALVGVGEGAYGPSANALLCAAAPPERRGRALSIYNVGMALGGAAGLVLGVKLAPILGWRGVFWIAGGPSVLLAIASAFVAAPERLPRPHALPARSYLLSPPYVAGLLAGILVTFGASALIFWGAELMTRARLMSEGLTSGFIAFVGFVTVAGVVAGGHAGDTLNRRARGGHALAIGVSLLLAIPAGAISLVVSSNVLFMALSALTAFFLAVYHGPSAAVVDEMGPPQFSATLQAVYLCGIHVLGNATAPPAVGWLADRSSLPLALQAAVAAFGLSGVLYVWVARWQRRSPPSW